VETLRGEASERGGQCHTLVVRGGQLAEDRFEGEWHAVDFLLVARDSTVERLVTRGGRESRLLDGGGEHLWTRSGQSTMELDDRASPPTPLHLVS
jgi:hypothetical protein